MVVVLTNLQSPAHLGVEAGDAAVGREARVHTRDRLLACMLVVCFAVLHGNLMSWERLLDGVLQATACTASPPQGHWYPDFDSSQGCHDVDPSKGHYTRCGDYRAVLSPWEAPRVGRWL